MGAEPAFGSIFGSPFGSGGMSSVSSGRQPIRGKTSQAAAVCREADASLVVVSPPSAPEPELGDLDAGEDGDGSEEEEFTVFGKRATEPPAAKRKRMGTHAECQCSICERMFAFSSCINIATEAYPHWRDKPCHNAAKAVDRAAESRGPDAKAALGKYKQLRRRDWVRDVLRVRICSPDDPPLPQHLSFDLMSCPDSLHERKDTVRKMLEDWSTHWDTSTLSDAVFMTRRQFIQHYKLKEGYTVKEAEDRWLRDEANLEIKREELPNGELTLAVAMPKRVRNTQGQGYNRGLAASEPFEADDFAALFSKMKMLKVPPPFQQVMDEAINDLTMSRCQPGDVKPRQTRQSHSAASDSSGLVLVPRGSTATRSVKSEAELDDDGDVVVESVVKTRQAFIRTAKQMLATTFTRRTSPLATLKAVIAKVGESNEEVVHLQAVALQKDLQTAGDTLAKLLGEAAANWTGENVKSQVAAAGRHMASVAVLVERANHAIDALKDVRKIQNCEAAGVRRRQMLVNTRRLAGVKGQQFPKTLVGWLGQSVFFYDPKGEEDVRVPGRMVQGPDADDCTVMRFWGPGAGDSLAIAAEHMTKENQSRVNKSLAAMTKIMDKSGAPRTLQAWLGDRQTNVTERPVKIMLSEGHP